MSITRSSISLPAEVANEILQKTQEESAIMQLARKVDLPGNGVIIPVITGDPEAAWVAEGAAKPVSEGTLSTKQMQAYKLAVIEPFSKEFTRDASALYNALRARLPKALGRVFDQTVIGAVTKPGDNFDNFASCTAQAITAATAYATLVAANGDVADHDGIVDGYAISPKMFSVLLNATDSTGRPIFINAVSEKAIPRLLGASTYQSKGLYMSGNPSVVGVAGDWTKAVWGTIAGVQVDVSEEATLTTSGGTINLWQQNMVAVRAEIEIGFRADTTVFNKFTLAE